MHRQTIWVLGFVVLIGGCSDGDKLIDVRGKVFIGEQSETKGAGFVTFHPDDKKGNKALEEGVGAIEPDGSYVLKTRDKVGVAPGWYKVGVSLAEVMDPNNPYVTNWLMPNPTKYRNWRESGISIEVVETPQPGQYDIKLPALGGQTTGAAPAAKS